MSWEVLPVRFTLQVEWKLWLLLNWKLVVGILDNRAIALADILF